MHQLSVEHLACISSAPPSRADRLPPSLYPRQGTCPVTLDPLAQPRLFLSSFYPCPLAPPFLASQHRAPPPTAAHAPPSRSIWAFVPPLPSPLELIQTEAPISPLPSSSSAATERCRGWHSIAKLSLSLPSERRDYDGARLWLPPIYFSTYMSSSLSYASNTTATFSQEPSRRPATSSLPQHRQPHHRPCHHLGARLLIWAAALLFPSPTPTSASPPSPPKTPGELLRPRCLHR
jgi:hypothetical protein